VTQYFQRIEPAPADYDRTRLAPKSNRLIAT
jgi:hypothetical protein